MSRKERIHDIQKEGYERQMTKKSSCSLERVPDYLSYFEFKKSEDSKKLAKEILKGNYDYQAEDDMLNRMIYNSLNRSEKHAFTLQNKRNSQGSKNFHKSPIR